ncbi:hypothetical protein UFOVP652_38 [uncultured Caudovirales phage]|uniref:Uncharacterized protein n=1 Tax=uncultured Caudovirales phage TaxID=2100421 RepID=A0A6J5N6Z1_9CAUD|nr:hypothetical protein UFOVP652_38 [uncultured Caudovirales phage]CAB5223740.1 hypothetical protein UFOVP734_1 [uncultured Caudovirales phage]
MKDEAVLTMLCEYLLAQIDVITCMAYARKSFRLGQEHASWAYLFEWAEATDAREEAWQALRPEYIKAVQLQEGVHEL